MNEPAPENKNEDAGEPEVTSGPPAIPAEITSILELMPEGEPRQRALLLMSRVVSRAYKGPVPDAEEMGRYKAVDETFPERFVQMAEKEQAHRHSLDTGDQISDYDLKKRGQNYAFASLVFLALVILALVFMEETTVAGILAGTTIVGIVGMFITGRVLEYKADAADPDGQ